MAVNTPSPEHNETSEQRQITRTLVGGTQAMRQAGKLFLPQEPRESETAYSARIERSVLTNIYGKTRSTFVGRVMKSLQLTDDTVTQIADIADDIDNAGNDIRTFATRAMEHAVDDGIVYFLVDAPKAPNIVAETEEGEVPVTRTRAMDEALGLRPFVNAIVAENMLFVRRDDDNKLAMVRYRSFDQRQDPDDEFSDIEVEQIHVLDMVEGRMRKRTYENKADDDSDADFEIVDEVLTEFESIPLVTLYTNRVRDDVAKPLFIDLANLNVRHWQSASDQANIVHVARVPILFGVGLVDESTQRPQSITIAANSVVHGEPGAQLSYVEHTGKAAEAGRQELQDLVDDMIRMGVEIVLNQKTGNQTATGRALDQAEADTLMNAVAEALENAFQEIFIHLADAFGEEVGEDGAGGLNLNKDYTLEQGDAANMVAQLVQIWTASGISHKAFIEELRRRGVLSEDFDLEADEELIEAEKDAALDREAAMMKLVAESSEPMKGEDEDDEKEEDDE